IVGRASATALWGGEGSDILIGRGGADTVIAEGGDDILIGARISYDLTPARLEDLMREWSRTDLTGYAKTQYKARAEHLLGTTPGGLNGTTTLTPARIVSDGAADTLQGGTELDWFFTTGTDAITDLAPRERVNADPPVPAVIGDVTVTAAFGHLYISEDADSVGLKQGVIITRLPNGNILVVGHDPTNSGGVSTLINGVASMEFAVTGSLFVNLGDGEDQLLIDARGGAGPVFEDLGIVMGGDDAPARVIIGALVTRGSLSVDTGGGDDWVFLSGSQIGDGFGFDQYVVNTGAGTDTVTIKNGTQINGWVDIQTYNSLTENDADVVYFDT